MKLAGGLRRQKGTDRQKEKNNQETKMRFYGTSSDCCYIIQKKKLEIESENQIKNQKQQQQQRKRENVGRKEMSGGEVWQWSRALLWTAYEPELNTQHVEMRLLPVSRLTRPWVRSLKQQFLEKEESMRNAMERINPSIPMKPHAQRTLARNTYIIIIPKHKPYHE